MIVVDTNLFIYLAQGKLDPEVFGELDLAYASVTRIEALGFHGILAAEASWLQEAFSTQEQIDLNEGIIAESIKLRQRLRMSLGDAIIAATALENDCVLWTANTADFAHIEGLQLMNPLQ